MSAKGTESGVRADDLLVSVAEQLDSAISQFNIPDEAAVL